MSPLIYHFPLSNVAIFLGLIYLITHIPPALQPNRFIAWMRLFPRSKVAGWVLITLAGLWSLWLVDTMDLGEFNPQRNIFLLIIAAGTGLTLYFVPDFLAVRGLGMLLLLGANVILDSVFLENTPWKLLLVINAYLWIVIGIIYVSSPYLMRRAIEWGTATTSRWQTLCWTGAGVGLVILTLGFTVY